MDLKEVAFHRRVREGYLRMVAEESQRWLFLDAARPIEAIQSDIRVRVDELLKRQGRKPQ
jgi:thymidylate kinase